MSYTIHIKTTKRVEPDSRLTNKNGVYVSDVQVGRAGSDHKKVTTKAIELSKHYRDHLIIVKFADGSGAWHKSYETEFYLDGKEYKTAPQLPYNSTQLSVEVMLLENPDVWVKGEVIAVSCDLGLAQTNSDTRSWDRKRIWRVTCADGSYKYHKDGNWLKAEDFKSIVDTAKYELAEKNKWIIPSDMDNIGKGVSALSLSHFQHNSLMGVYRNLATIRDTYRFVAEHAIEPYDTKLLAAAMKLQEAIDLMIDD